MVSVHTTHLFWRGRMYVKNETKMMRRIFATGTWGTVYGAGNGKGTVSVSGVSSRTNLVRMTRCTRWTNLLLSS